MVRPERDTWWPPRFLLSSSSPSSIFNLLICIILKIIDCCTNLGNYSLLFVTKLQRISHFKFEFLLPSSNFLVPPFYPQKHQGSPNNQYNAGAADVKGKPISRDVVREGRAGGGAWAPSVRNPSPLSPQMKWHFLQGSMESRQFESRSAPPLPWRPLILKRLATPQLMRQLKTSLSLNMDIRDNYYLDLLYSWSIYLTSPVKH